QVHLRSVMGKHESTDRIKVWPVMAAKGGPRVSETIARPARTTIHAAVGSLLVALYSAKVHHLSREEAATYAVLVTAAVNAVWVAVENRLERGLLRQVPPKTVPVVDAAAGVRQI